MSKLIAVIFVIILFGAIFYVYNQNVNDIGVKIDKLKLKYTIGDGASAEKILLFSNDLSTMAQNSSKADKKRLEFESKFWNVAGIAKEVATTVGNGDNYAYKCNSDIAKMKTQIKTAEQIMKDAKVGYELIKDQYTNLEQKEFESQFVNINYSLTSSENILFIFCPQ
jgi:hypothetical protein